jgi:hypothetical protein
MLHLMFWQITFVIPGRAEAERRREPGIHNRFRWLWIPRLALRARPE